MVTVIIEVSVYICLASMMIFCLNVLNKKRLTKRRDFIYFGVILSLITTQLFIQISPEIRGSIHIITYICVGTIFALFLIYYFITRIAVSNPEMHENIRSWIGWTTFLVLGISFCMLLIEPNTKADLFRMPFALALCLGMEYYLSVLDQLIALRNGAEENMEESKETVLDTTTEMSIEEHKEVVINLATESWRLAKVFELAITQLNVDKPRRYTSRIEWFIKKAEESLESTGLRLVNLEGQPYDPGMAAAPVNIEEFDIDDPLEVNLMVEPIIMDGITLVKRGKVSLRRTES